MPRLQRRAPCTYSWLSLRSSEDYHCALLHRARSGIRKHAKVCGRLRRNFTAVNVFGLNQYDGQTQFFDPSNPLLPEVRALLQARHPTAPVTSSAPAPGGQAG